MAMLLMGEFAHPNSWERELKKQDSVIVDIIYKELKKQLKDEYKDFPWLAFEKEFEDRIAKAIKQAQQENIMEIINWERRNGNGNVGRDMFGKYLGTNYKKGRISHEQRQAKNRLEKKRIGRKQKKEQGEESEKEKLGKELDAALDELERSLKKQQTQNLFGSQLYF